MLRYINGGDFFCFELPDGKGYGCGRVVAKLSIGHAVEVYEGVEPLPQFSSGWFDKKVSFYEIIDSYSLFDRKKEGDWRILVTSCALSVDYDFDAAWFGYGTKGGRQKVNLAGSRFDCSEEEYASLPAFRPAGNKTILKKMGFSI